MKAQFSATDLGKYGIKMDAAEMSTSAETPTRDEWRVEIAGEWLPAIGIEIFALRKAAIAERPALRASMPEKAMILRD